MEIPSAVLVVEKMDQIGGHEKVQFGIIWLQYLKSVSVLFIFVYPSFLFLRTPPTLCSKRLLPFLVEINVRFLVSWTGGRSEQSKKKDCREGDARRELY